MAYAEVRKAISINTAPLLQTITIPVKVAAKRIPSILRSGSATLPRLSLSLCTPPRTTHPLSSLPMILANEI